jgi:cytochrome c oxidase subunit I
LATTVRPAPGHAPEPYSEQSGLWSWLTTVDHKRIGILYLYTALGFFVWGGMEAMIMRIQLGAPNQHIVSAEFYNQLFTMHGHDLPGDHAAVVGVLQFSDSAADWRS